MCMCVLRVCLRCYLVHTSAVMHVELHSQEHDEEIPPFSLHALSKQPEGMWTIMGSLACVRVRMCVCTCTCA